MRDFYSKIKGQLFTTKEGVLLTLGVILFFMTMFFILASYVIDHDFANKISGVIFTNLFIGRVPGLSFGFAAELPHWLVIAVTILAEMITVLFIYSLFVFSFNDIVHIKMLEEFFQQVKTKKGDYQKYFDRYGAIAIFVFVLIPFWMTGPIVGSIIGFLIGLKHYRTMLIVCVSTCIAVTLWGLFLQEIIDYIMHIDSSIVWTSLGVAVAAVIIYKIKKEMFK